MGQWASDPLPGRNALTFPRAPGPGGRKRTGPIGAGGLFPPALGQEGGVLHVIAHLRGVSASGCALSATVSFLSMVTTEGEVSEAQRLLTRKPVRNSEMEQCCCGTTARVYIEAPPTVPIESSRGRSL